MAMDFPASPSVGQTFNNGLGTTYIWDGITWNVIPQMAPAMASDTPPSNPSVGQFWWRSTNGQLYIYVNDGNSSQWVQASGFAQTVGLWESILGVRDLTGLATMAWADLNPFIDLRLRFSGVMSTNANLNLRTSTNNGSSYDSGASDYTNGYLTAEAATVAAITSVSANAFSLSNVTLASAFTLESTTLLSSFNKAIECMLDTRSVFTSATPAIRTTQAFGRRVATTARNALQLNLSAGTFTSGYALLEGVRG